MKLLENKIALITGAGSGIGRASALLFAREGAHVIVSNRREDLGNETVQMITDEGNSGDYLYADLSKHSDIKTLVSTIVDRFGSLDCAFNNGGTDGTKANIADCDEENWDSIIDTNLKGTFLLMKYQIRQMLKQGQGSIVNMASVCGVVARPGRCAYNASRHGVIALTKTAALEYAGLGIKINAVGPGSIKTDIFHRSTKGNKDLEELYAKAHPVGRVGSPEEVAEAALWLCSDKSSFVSGHTLMTDGGFTIQ